MVATLTCGSCGGDRQHTLTMGEYRAQANKICATAIADVNNKLVPVIEGTLAGMGEEPFEPDELQEFYGALTLPAGVAGRLVDDMLTDLRTLPSPAEHAADYVALWDDIETTMHRSRVEIERASRDPEAAVRLWKLDTSPFARIDVRARELSVTSCRLDS
jgi:hypothetical protein